MKLSDLNINIGDRLPDKFYINIMHPFTIYKVSTCCFSGHQSWRVLKNGKFEGCSDPRKDEYIESITVDELEKKIENINN